MPICSYLVVPAPERNRAVLARLSALPGCDAVRATNHDVIALITETAGPAEEKALRHEIEKIDGIFAMVLTFGELEPGEDAS